VTFDEQAATLDRKSVASLLASHQQLSESNQPGFLKGHDELKGSSMTVCA